MSTHPHTRRWALKAAAAAAALGSLAMGMTGNAQAQPLDGPLRLVVGYAPGGTTDMVARFVGDRLAQTLGVPVVVDNKPGAGGRLAAQQLKGAPAGQNVLMVANPAVMVVAPLVFKDNGYDPERDFQAVSHVNDYDFGLAVAPGVPAQNLTQLLDWMRANPNQSNIGVPATGSLPHFFALMLGQSAKVRAEVIGYKGSATVITDLIGGQVPIAVDTFDAQLPHYQAGKFRILAMSGAKRSSLAPDVPTFKESGLDLTGTGWNAFFAPAAMPREKVDRLAQAIQAVMQEPEMQRRFADNKLVPVVSTRAQTEAMLKAYRAQWAPVVKTSGYQP
ncbi:Bug family tripartite tricarboxylate transporter substrate binding protein [Xenophilus arseniciresistens]